MTTLIGTEEPVVLKTDEAGRVRTPAARREHLLDEFAHSGLSGAKFAALAGIKYSTFAAWVHRRRQPPSSLAPMAHHPTVHHDYQRPSGGPPEGAGALPHRGQLGLGLPLGPLARLLHLPMDERVIHRIPHRFLTGRFMRTHLFPPAAGKLLLVSEDIVKTALAKSMADGELAQENIAGRELVFLPALKRAEENIAERIKNLAAQPPNYPVVEFDKAVAWCQQKTGKELTPSQREAVKQALTNRLIVITGGSGVGKATLINAILKILCAKKVKCLLCAPSGSWAPGKHSSVMNWSPRCPCLLLFPEDSGPAERMVTSTMLVPVEEPVVTQSELSRLPTGAAHLKLVGVTVHKIQGTFD